MPRTGSSTRTRTTGSRRAASLSYSQIALYLGAFFLFAGSLFYFAAHRFYDAVRGIVRPFCHPGRAVSRPECGGRWLYRQDHRAVAVAFYLAGVSLLPLVPADLVPRDRLWVVPTDAPGQIFERRRPCPTASCRSRFSSRASGRAGSRFGRARARSARCSRCSSFLFALAVLGDFGLRDLARDGRYDRLALHLAPLVPLYAAGGYALDRAGGRGSRGRCSSRAACRSSRCSTCSRSTAACSTASASRWTVCSPRRRPIPC